jgi:hypothetical protein
LAVGSWQLAVGSWQLAVGSWQLAVGSWQLAVGKNISPSKIFILGFETILNHKYYKLPNPISGDLEGRF